MKTKPLLLFLPSSHGVRTGARIVLFFALVFSLPGMAAAQSVVIEGGPDTIQISDRDGKPEPVTPGETAPPQQTGPPLVRPPIRPVDAIPAPTANRVVGPAGIPKTPATARDVVEPPRTLAVGEAKRLAELKRELGILDTGTSAALSLDVGNVFRAGTTTVDRIAEEKLTLIAEYIQLALAREIQLTYHFAPNLHDKDLAWSRSVAMVKWMTEKGGMAESSFTILNPEVVTEPAPTAVPDDGERAAMQNRIEFTILFR
ncbi:MAG: hypothetical protein GXX91_03190 [Verrucomicrobiaceae bacterium]|nr:hypothetical protein [Verrucomicrobiaceae bacterium]